MTAQTILPANSAVSGGFDVANSVRLDGNAYMYKDQSGGNRQKFTMSCWTKLTSGYGGSAGSLLSVNGTDDDTNFHFGIDHGDASGGASDSLFCHIYGADAFRTTPLLRDYSAWYHIVLAVDTTQAAAENRMKVYVNNVQQTLSQQGDYPDQNDNFGVNENGARLGVGTHPGSVAAYALNSYLCEYVLIDGSQLTPASFAEADEDSGIWKPIKVSGLTFGTNGFYLNFQASGNLGNDANGGTDLTEVSIAATDQSTDTCTNNFATFNLLNNLGSNIAYSEGNLVITPGTSDYKTCISTMAVDSGKWYAEFKAVSGHNGSTDVSVGIVGADDHISSTGSKALSAYLSSFGYGSGGLVKKYNNVTIRTDATYTDDDIIGIAVDMDNLKLYWSKNGTYNNSGDPTSGATGTGAVAITPAQLYYIAVATISSGGVKVFAANFGSPPYSESGGNSDADGHGNFLTAPPSGYFALCTKNLAEYGG
jgi:hypothetical protein